MTKYIRFVVIFLIIAFSAGFVSPLPISGCDTWVALENATEKGIVLFAKNSDRLLFPASPSFSIPERPGPRLQIDLGRLHDPAGRKNLCYPGIPSLLVLGI